MKGDAYDRTKTHLGKALSVYPLHTGMKLTKWRTEQREVTTSKERDGERVRPCLLMRALRRADNSGDWLKKESKRDITLWQEVQSRAKIVNLLLIGN